MRDEVVDWLEEAKEELKTSEQLYASKRYAHACFHAQQAAEKALKALIIHTRRYYHRSHDLVELHNEVKCVLEIDERLKARLAELSAHYTQSRYPNAGLRRPSLEIGEEQAARSLETAKALVDAVAEHLRREA